MSDLIVFAALGAIAVTGLLIWLLVRINPAQDGKPKRSGDEGAAAAAFAPMAAYGRSHDARDQSDGADAGNDSGSDGGGSGDGGGGGD
jgi:hypothetical protein